MFDLASLRWLLCILVVAGCGSSTDPQTGPDAAQDAPTISCDALPADKGEIASYTTAIRVVDEQGAAIAGAQAELDDQTLTANACGEVAIEERTDAAMVVLRHPGFLPEPVVIGFSDRGQVVDVRMFADKDGSRWVMHSGGDVMLGRRYEDNPYGPPLLPAGDIAGGARHVVAPVARAFAAADLRTVNLETVVSNLPASAGYPAKTVVINTSPEAMAGLVDLDVNLAVLGNNHVRDYFEEGISQTRATLDGLGIAYAGASAGGGSASTPHIADIRGLRVATLSWSTHDGSSSNDGYAIDSDPVPSNLDPADAWQYEARSWSFSGATLTVPAAQRRAGSAWRLFRDAESAMDATETAQAWASLHAVYPELQDWVERRGHGGAAWWQTSQATADIQALRAGADVIIVQIHGSNEFADAPAPSVLQHARNAIDAGADAVILHHPHVLQGVEWYKGRLIVHSLGNFLFDQHYEITTPTAFLRTVWEGTTLIEARMIPLDLGNYRPIPVAGAAAVRATRLLWEKSASGSFSDTHSNRRDTVTFLAPPAADTARGHVRMRSHDAVFSAQAPATQVTALTVAAGAVHQLDEPGLVHARAGGAYVLMGRDLFGWGGLEDELADGEAVRDLHWRVIHSDTAVVADDGAAAGRGHVTLHRTATNQSDAWVATFARIALPEHRYFVDMNGTSVAADGDATYTIQMQARLDNPAAPYLRLDQYTRDESKPSAKLGEYVIPFTVPADGQWHTVEVTVPAAALVVDTRRVGAIKPQIRLPPPDAAESTLAVDDLRVIEWRDATAMPDVFGAYDYVRNAAAAPVNLELTVMPLGDL